MDIQIKKLKKVYGKKIVLDITDLSFESGNIYGIVGENNAGKSTFATILTGHLKPSEININIDDNSIKDMVSLRNKIGFLTDSKLIEESTSPEKMSSLFEILYDKWDNIKYHNYLKLFKVPVDGKISNFSYGTYRKFIIAVALSHSASLIVLDEPTKGLDPESRYVVSEEIRKYMDDVNEAIILLYSHDLVTLEECCDHIILIHNGKNFFEADLPDLSPKWPEQVYVGFTEYYDRIDDYDVDKIGKCYIEYEEKGKRMVKWLCKKEDCPPTKEKFIPTLEEVYLLLKAGEERRKDDKKII